MHDSQSRLFCHLQLRILTKDAAVMPIFLYRCRLKVSQLQPAHSTGIEDCLIIKPSPTKPEGIPDVCVLIIPPKVNQPTIDPVLPKLGASSIHDRNEVSALKKRQYLVSSNYSIT